MSARLVTLLPLTTLLLSLLACITEERLPPAPAVSTTAFRYAGRLVSCEATATTSASYAVRYIGSNSYATTDIVSIDLHATGQADPAALLLTYECPHGKSAYDLTIVIYLSGKDNDPPALLDYIAGTLCETNSGFFKGSFTNTKPGSSSLSEGRFTHVPIVKRY
jgi:hypothetical protein